ncbi:MAG: D-2-hydroxyacid dehydrogenase [Chloroflexota bacterium]|nr:D-2-hydroxyacid dehydrogenase [Chloroflexota bacterium]
MPKLVVMPPLNDLHRGFARRLAVDLPEYRVVAPETEAEAGRELADADAAFGWVPPNLLPLATRLRWLQNPDAGPPPGYFYASLIDHPVVVCNPRGIYNDHISQHIMMFLLALARGLPYYAAAQRERRWEPDARPGPALDLTNATALIVGFGGIGHETARLCAAFGMQVIGVDPRWEHEPPEGRRHRPEDLDGLLPLADVVVATTPHTPETEGMWDARRFALMKPSAFFINIGRGRTTRLEDLTSALERGEIAGCGLDVFEVEPLPRDHRLWTLPNVLLTPHIAVKDAENLPERRYQVLLENARRFATGERLRNVVDKVAWY